MTTLTTNTPAVTVANPFAIVRTWIQRIEARAALSKLTAAQLEDAGYTFADIDAEVTKPFWQE